MKNKTIMAVLLLLSVFFGMSASWALPTPADIESQVKAGNLPQAEKMILEVIAAKPQEPKAHYYYAQLAERQANLLSDPKAKKERLETAYRELMTAKSLGPSLSFGNKAKITALEDRLASARVEVTVPPAPRAAAPSAPTVPSDNAFAMEVIKQERGPSGNAFLLFMCGLIMIVVGVAGAIYRHGRVEDSREKEKKAADDLAAKEQHLKTLLTLKDTVAKNKLEWEFSPQGLPTWKAGDFTQAEQRIQNALEQVTRADKGWSSMSFRALEREVLSSCATPAEREAQQKETEAKLNEMAERSARDKARREETQRAEKRARKAASVTPKPVSRQPSPQVQEVHHYHETPAQSSSGGLGDVLVGAALMSMLSNNSHSDSGSSRSSHEDKSYTAPSAPKQDDWDNGGNTSDWSSSSSSSSSTDDWDS